MSAAPEERKVRVNDYYGGDLRAVNYPGTEWEDGRVQIEWAAFEGGNVTLELTHEEARALGEILSAFAGEVVSPTRERES